VTPGPFAINLKRIRLETLTSQRQLAALIPGFTQSKISAFERGLVPSDDDAAALAAALGVTVEALQRAPRPRRRLPSRVMA
jgi:transcriptional regulator with XRE-family HTH domain